MAEEAARPLFQQLMTAVEYCHSIGIANRDVKVTAPTGSFPLAPALAVHCWSAAHNWFFFAAMRLSPCNWICAGGSAVIQLHCGARDTGGICPVSQILSGRLKLCNV